MKISFKEQLEYTATQPWCHKWLANLVNRNPEFTYAYRSIVDSFPWGRSPEGSFYWSNIHKEVASKFKNNVKNEFDYEAIKKFFEKDYPEVFL